jgi:hypothetical protein
MIVQFIRRDLNEISYELYVSSMFHMYLELYGIRYLLFLHEKIYNEYCLTLNLFMISSDMRIDTR